MKRFMFFAFLLLAAAGMLISSSYVGVEASDMEEGLELELTAKYSSDFFSFNYPEDWYIVREHEEVDGDSLKFFQVDIVDEENLTGTSRRFSADYSVDDEWSFREDRDEFYAALNDLRGFFEESEDIEVKYGSELTYNERPAYRMRIKGEENIHPAAEETVEAIIDVIFIYDNQHQQSITFFSRVEEYNREKAEAFFDSFEFE